MKRPVILLTVSTCAVLSGCDALSTPTSKKPSTYQEALKHDVSFTQHAVTTHLIIRNEGGCDRLSGGWKDEKGIQNLLFVGDEKYQKWAREGHYTQDTVAMAVFWERKVQFVFACETAGNLRYIHSPQGRLDQDTITRFGNNLVLTSKVVDGKVEFFYNYPLSSEGPGNQRVKK